MGAVSFYRDKLNGIKSKRIFKMPEIMLDAPKMRFSMMVESLKGSMAEINSINRERFANINAKLIALNPMAVLARGYGAIYNQNDEIIKSTKEISVGDNIKVRLHDGSFNASVTEGED